MGRLLPLLPRPLRQHVSPLYRLLLLSSRLLLLPSLLTMTMLMHQLILTSTHSSTHMTPHIVTSSSTGTEPTLEVTLLSPMVFPPVQTVLVSTHSSALLMLLTGVRWRTVVIVKCLTNLIVSTESQAGSARSTQ